MAAGRSGVEVLRVLHLAWRLKLGRTIVGLGALFVGSTVFWARIGQHPEHLHARPTYDYLGGVTAVDWSV